MCRGVYIHVEVALSQNSSPQTQQQVSFWKACCLAKALLRLAFTKQSSTVAIILAYPQKRVPKSRDYKSHVFYKLIDLSVNTRIPPIRNLRLKLHHILSQVKIVAMSVMQRERHQIRKKSPFLNTVSFHRLL